MKMFISVWRTFSLAFVTKSMHLMSVLVSILHLFFTSVLLYIAIYKVFALPYLNPFSFWGKTLASYHGPLDTGDRHIQRRVISCHLYELMFRYISDDVRIYKI